MADRITCLGSGNIYLDRIIVREYPEGCEKQRTFKDNLQYEEVGGTCGNVMAILPHLGVCTFPMLRSDLGRESSVIKESLEEYGADTRFVTSGPDGGCYILDCNHRQDKDGRAFAKFRKRGPNGNMYPTQRFLNMEDAVSFAKGLDFVPDVFFFDNQAAGHYCIANVLRPKGTLVYFEPEGYDGKVGAFRKRVDASDIIKYSGEKILDESWQEGYTDKLFIKTLKEEGVAFSLRGGKWQVVPPVANDNVVDTEGAGDTLTSAFIAELCKGGHLKASELTEDIVREALQKAQELASRSVSHLGSKGMIRANSK